MQKTLIRRVDYRREETMVETAVALSPGGERAAARGPGEGAMDVISPYLRNICKKMWSTGGKDITSKRRKSGPF